MMIEIVMMMMVVMCGVVKEAWKSAVRSNSQHGNTEHLSWCDPGTP